MVTVKSVWLGVQPLVNAASSTSSKLRSQSTPTHHMHTHHKRISRLHPACTSQTHLMRTFQAHIPHKHLTHTPYAHSTHASLRTSPPYFPHTHVTWEWGAQDRAHGGMHVAGGGGLTANDAHTHTHTATTTQPQPHHTTRTQAHAYTPCQHLCTRRPMIPQRMVHLTMHTHKCNTCHATQLNATIREQNLTPTPDPELGWRIGQ